MIASPVPSRESEALARVRRLKRDDAYWFKCCYRIKDKGEVLDPEVLEELYHQGKEPADLGSKIVPYVQNEVQALLSEYERAMLRKYGWAFLYVLKGRQSGISTDQQAKNLKTIWRRPHTDVITLADNRENTAKIFKITRRAIKNFPPALLPKMGGADTYEVSFTERDSNFWTGTAGAATPGRGSTLARIHASEFAWWADPRGTLAAVAPGLEGVPGSVIVLETTPSTFESEPHLFWRETVKGMSGFQPIFLPWWRCDPQRYRRALDHPEELGPLTDHEALLVKMHGLSLEEIKWRRAKVEFYGEAEFLKEYPEDDEGCWLVGGTPFYNRARIQMLAQMAPRPIRYVPAGDKIPTPGGEGEKPWLIDRDPIRGRQDGEVWVYGEPDPTDRGLILGCDTAEGQGGDASTYTIRAFPSWRLIEDYSSTTIEPRQFAAIIDTRARGRSTYLVIEKNGHGVTVLRHLRDAGYDRRLIYHRVPLDDRNPESRTDRMGWATTATSQPLLLDAGRDLLYEACAGRIPPPSMQTVRDASSVQRDKSGSVSLTGKDMLVSELLAWIGRTAPRAG